MSQYLIPDQRAQDHTRFVVRSYTLKGLDLRLSAIVRPSVGRDARS